MKRLVNLGSPVYQYVQLGKPLGFLSLHCGGQLPCVVCGKAAPSEAAHVRFGSDGVTGLKPSDHYSMFLCTSCHALQHEFGELRFWSAFVHRSSQRGVALVDGIGGH
jgi:hypothetical protein